MELVVVEDAEHQLGDMGRAALLSLALALALTSPRLEEGEQRVGDGGVAAHVQAEGHVEGPGVRGEG